MRSLTPRSKWSIGRCQLIEGKETVIVKCVRHICSTALIQPMDINGIIGYRCYFVHRTYSTKSPIRQVFVSSFRISPNLYGDLCKL